MQNPEKILAAYNIVSEEELREILAIKSQLLTFISDRAKKSPDEEKSFKRANSNLTYEMALAHRR